MNFCKIFLILGFLLLIGLLTFSFFLVEKFQVNIMDVIANIPLSEGEIKGSIGKFGRNYPRVIKGLWEPSSIHFNKALRDADRLKEIGVNTVCVSVEYEFDDDGNYYLAGDERTLISNIIKAKRKGFAVLVAPNFVTPSFMEREKLPVNMEEFIRISHEIAIKWANISEQYGVEFFAPQNEFDVMASRFVNSNEERFNLTAAWHREILPDIRKVFHGKLIAKLADASPDMNLSGYDLIGITVFHGNLDLEEFRKEVKEEYRAAANSARISNARWMVSEAWFPYGGPFYPETVNRKGELLDELQDDYIRISIDEYLNTPGNPPAGYIFTAWTMPGMDVRGREAERVIRQFFLERI